MIRLTVLAMIALAALGTAQAQDPTFKAQMERLEALVQEQQAATNAAILRALQPPLEVPAVAPQKPVATAPRKLDPVEAEALRKALERGARCLTGKLVKDPYSPLWVPEMKPNCH